MIDFISARRESRTTHHLGLERTNAGGGARST